MERLLQAMEDQPSVSSTHCVDLVDGVTNSEQQSDSHVGGAENRNDPTGKRWQCDLCRRYFSDRFVLLRHKQLHANAKGRLLQCRYCSKTFSRKDRYRLHLAQDHPQQKLDPQALNTRRRYQPEGAASVGSESSTNHEIRPNNEPVPEMQPNYAQNCERQLDTSTDAVERLDHSSNNPLSSESDEAAMRRQYEERLVAFATACGVKTTIFLPEEYEIYVQELCGERQSQSYKQRRWTATINGCETFVDGTCRLYRLVERDDVQFRKYFLRVNEFWDALTDAHIKTNHGRRVSISDELGKQYANVNRHAVVMFLSYLQCCPEPTSGRKPGSFHKTQQPTLPPTSTPSSDSPIPIDVEAEYEQHQPLPFAVESPCQTTASDQSISRSPSLSLNDIVAQTRNSFGAMLWQPSHQAPTATAAITVQNEPIQLPIASHSSPNAALPLARTSQSNVSSLNSLQTARNTWARSLTSQAETASGSRPEATTSKQCQLCGIIFNDLTLYLLHKGLHSDSDPWRCNLCGVLCGDKYSFHTHVITADHSH